MTLFSILRELKNLGIVDTASLYSPHMGAYEVYTIGGVRLRIITGVVGDLRNYARDAVGHFDQPTDVVLNHDGSVLTYAPSCV